VRSDAIRTQRAHAPDPTNRSARNLVRPGASNKSPNDLIAVLALVGLEIEGFCIVAKRRADEAGGDLVCFRDDRFVSAEARREGRDQSRRRRRSRSIAVPDCPAPGRRRARAAGGEFATMLRTDADPFFRSCVGARNRRG